VKRTLKRDDPTRADKENVCPHRKLNVVDPPSERAQIFYDFFNVFD
jgi:hypothetical protein